MAGNEEFTRSTVFRNLASGQNPECVMVACSDSRVPPEVILNSGLNALFTIRAIGEVLGDEGVASIEYGVNHLKTKDGKKPEIIIMGHTGCGAVKAALDVIGGSEIHEKTLSSVVGSIAEGLRRRDATNDMDRAVTANVDEQAQRLYDRSESIRNLVDKGEVKIYSIIYDISTGKLSVPKEANIKRRNRSTV